MHLWSYHSVYGYSEPLKSLQLQYWDCNRQRNTFCCTKYSWFAANSGNASSYLPVEFPHDQSKKIASNHLRWYTNPRIAEQSLAWLGLSVHKATAICIWLFIFVFLLLLLSPSLFCVFFHLFSSLSRGMECFIKDSYRRSYTIGHGNCKSRRRSSSK